MLEVSVSIPLDRSDWPKLQTDLRESFGPVGDTGIGLGYSDSNFVVKTRKQGAALKSEILKYLAERGIPAGDTADIADDGKSVVVCF